MESIAARARHFFHQSLGPELGKVVSKRSQGVRGGEKRSHFRRVKGTPMVQAADRRCWQTHGRGRRKARKLKIDGHLATSGFPAGEAL
jgi:hypothetical protein